VLARLDPLLTPTIITQVTEIYNPRKENHMCHSLLLAVDLSQTLEMNPCASLDPSPDTQKPDTIASHCALHPATCHPRNHRAQLNNEMTKRKNEIKNST